MAADFVAEPGPIAALGTSHPAFVKLLGKRRYRLVGVERLVFNAVFVRNDLAPALLEASAEACLRGPIVGIGQAQLEAGHAGSPPTIVAVFDAQPAWSAAACSSALRRSLSGG